MHLHDLAPGTLTLLLATSLGLGGCTVGSTSAPQAERSCGARPSLDTPLSGSARPAPLVIELPVPQLNPLARALEGEGLALVRYDGCSLEVLRGCAASGSYAWSAEPPSSFALSLPTLASIDAEAPFGAGGLRPVLEELGPLRLFMTAAGRYVAERGGVELSGSECERATHVVEQVVIGTWAVTAAGSVRVDVDAEVHGGTVRGSSFEQYGFARGEGDPAACLDPSAADGAAAEGPSQGCRSLLQIELVELTGSP